MKFNHFLSFAVILALVGLGLFVSIILLSGFGDKPGTNNKDYSIGVLVPLTGAGSTQGTPFANGLLLAVQEINQKGGINGKPLRLEIQDTKLEAQTSVDVANFLLQVKDPDVFVALFHLPTQAINPILRSAKKPLLYDAYTRSPWEDNPFAFKANFDSLTGCEKLASWAKDHNRFQKFGIIMARVEYNELCVQGLRKAEPNLYEYWYSFGEKDFRTLLAKANRDGVDAVAIIGLDYEYAALFRQLSETGYPIKILCATANECITPAVEKAASPSTLEHTLSIDFISPQISQTSFALQYRSVYPLAGFTDYSFAMQGFEEATIIAAAMQRCSPGDSACLVGSLKNVKDYPTLYGSHGFKDRILQIDTRLYEYQNQKWVPVNG